MIRHRILEWVARVLREIAWFCEEGARRCSYCPDCGRNRYTGRPCKNT